MKKSILLFSFILALVFTGTAAFKSLGDIPVEKFKAVSIAVPGKVFVEIGDKHSLEINAPDDVLDAIEVKVEDEKLIIKRKNNGMKKMDGLEIYIVSPEINGISIAGSADVFAGKYFPAGELEVKIAGSGKMDFSDLKADELEIKIAGSGDVFLKGQGAQEMEISIAGSGNVDAPGFAVQEVSAKISGSGDCVIHAVQELNATISGSGDIKYAGSPEVNTTIAGSGSVSKLN